MTVKITNWFDTEEESGCCQTETYLNVKYVKFEDQYHLENGNWIYIQLSKNSPQWKKHKDMNGLVIIQIDENDDVEIF